MLNSLVPNERKQQISYLTGCALNRCHTGSQSFQHCRHIQSLSVFPITMLFVRVCCWGTTYKLYYSVLVSFSMKICTCCKMSPKTSQIRSYSFFLNMGSNGNTKTLLLRNTLRSSVQWQVASSWEFIYSCDTWRKLILSVMQNEITAH